ncbi:acyl-CoA dehydrogenase family protein [Streptomyces sp. bgisy100]|uniref:acyl-CoA dehydrogenase family protein n=1 Tax=Streptomyces sp. bgisy100 TaxID=3413783 RepID=UPI003D70621F
MDRELWRHLGAVGFFGLRLPEEHPSGAGAGLGLPEAVLIFEEAGRALVPGPLLATHLAAGLVEGAATGEVIVTAMDGGPHGIPPEEEMEGSPSEGAVRAVRAMRVVRVGEAGEAEGAVRAGEAEGVVGVEGVAGADALVEHLSSADAVLVIGGTAVAVLLPDRITARPLRSVDPLTPLHRHEAAAGSRGVVRGGADSPGSRAAALASDGVPTQFGSPRCQAAELRREAVLLTAAQQLGSAGRTVEAAVLHARERRQFGQAIGAFQAIKHLCADMLVRAELARSAVYAAAVTGDGDDIAAAKLLADEAAVRNARDCLQVSGGMGFTWESEVHLHLKRAWLRAGQWLSESSAEEALAASLVEAEPAAGR